MTALTGKSKWYCVLMDEDTIVYHIYSFRGHAYRAYPDGGLGSLDKADRIWLDTRRNNHGKG